LWTGEGKGSLGLKPRSLQGKVKRERNKARLKRGHAFLSLARGKKCPGRRGERKKGQFSKEEERKSYCAVLGIIRGFGEKGRLIKEGKTIVWFAEKRGESDWVRWEGSHFLHVFSIISEQGGGETFGQGTSQTGKGRTLKGKKKIFRMGVEVRKKAAAESLRVRWTNITVTSNRERETRQFCTWQTAPLSWRGTIQREADATMKGNIRNTCKTVKRGKVTGGK